VHFLGRTYYRSKRIFLGKKIFAFFGCVSAFDKKVDCSHFSYRFFPSFSAGVGISFFTVFHNNIVFENLAGTIWCNLPFAPY